MVHPGRKRQLILILLTLQAAACRELTAPIPEATPCIKTFEQCGGAQFDVSGSCCNGEVCVVRDHTLAECLTEELAAMRMEQGWDGTVLENEEMPAHVLGSSQSALTPYSGPDDLDCEEEECINVFEQCGGGYSTSSLCCNPHMECVVKNWFYAQCLPETSAAYNVAKEGWDGRLLHCESMPDDVIKAPIPGIDKPLTSEEVLALSKKEAPESDPNACTNCDTALGPAPSSLSSAPQPLGTHTPLLAAPSNEPTKAEALPQPPAGVAPIPEVAAPVSSPVQVVEVKPSAEPPVDQPAPVVSQPLVEPAPVAQLSPAIAEPPMQPAPVLEPFPPITVPAAVLAPDTEPPAIEPVDMPAPAATKPSPSEPSKAAFTYHGELTYYGGAGVGGHCTQDFVPEGLTTLALNAPQYARGLGCGMCVHACFDNLELGQGERCFDGIVDDECPECVQGDLDLGESGSGRWPVDWSIIRCPDPPQGLMFSTQGSNPYYAKVKVQGGPSSVSSMTCNGLPGSLQPDAFFVFMSSTGAFACGMDCQVSFSNGFGTGAGRVTPAQLGDLCN